jgi:hypothetical protein
MDNHPSQNQKRTKTLFLSGMSCKKIIISCVAWHFQHKGILSIGNVTKKHFVNWKCHQKGILSVDHFTKKSILSNGNATKIAFHQLAVIKQAFCQLALSPKRHVVNLPFSPKKAFCQLAMSLKRHFVNCNVTKKSFCQLIINYTFDQLFK